jgi:hypothetical protein
MTFEKYQKFYLNFYYNHIVELMLRNMLKFIFYVHVLPVKLFLLNI